MKLIRMDDNVYEVFSRWLRSEPYPSEHNYPRIIEAWDSILSSVKDASTDTIQSSESTKWQVIRHGLAMFVEECARIACEHGFWDNKDNPDRLCMLIVGEVSEAHEELRSGRGPCETYYEETSIGKKPCGVPSEFADILIRVADHAAQLNIHNLPNITIEKMQYNEKRPFKHGRQF